MFSGFFKKSDKNKPNLGDLEEKENCPFLMEAEGRKPKIAETKKSDDINPMPKGHGKFSEEDKDKCPFY